MSNPATRSRRVEWSKGNAWRENRVENNPWEFGARLHCSTVSAGKVTEMWCSCLDTAVDHISETSDNNELTVTDLVHETRILFQKLIVTQLVINVPVSSDTQKCVTMWKAHHMTSHSCPRLRNILQHVRIYSDRLLLRQHPLSAVSGWPYSQLPCISESSLPHPQPEDVPSCADKRPA
jgi:hypothetical protein